MGIYNFETQGNMCMYDAQPILSFSNYWYFSFGEFFFFHIAFMHSVCVCSFSFPFSVFEYFYRWKINSANEDVYGMFRIQYSEANLVYANLYIYMYANNNFAKMFDAIQIFNKVSAQITTHIR